MARQIVVEIIGDASKFKGATDEATANAKKTGVSFAQVAKAGAIVATATIAAGAAVFSMGSKFEALDAKARTVFGESLPMVDAWAKANAGAMGLTGREATGLAANMADLLIPMGMTRDAAAEMATGIVGLSGALSEWTGGQRSAAEVSTILQKALLGEREGLKELGISISDADVKAQLLKDGTDQLTGSALEQAKAMATQTLIMAKTTDAQTAFADGTAKGLRAQNEMNAKLGEVGETIITGLYPAVATIAGFLADNLPAAIAFAQEAFQAVREVIEPIAAVVLPVLGAAFGVLMGVVRAVLPVVRTVFNTVADVVRAVAPVFRAVFGTIGNILSVAGAAFGVLSKVVGAVFAVIGKVIGAAVGVVKGYFNTLGTVIGVLGKVFDGLGKLISRVFGAIAGVVKGAINFVIGIVNGVIGAINSIQVHIEVGPVKFDFNGLNLPKIPRLHEGGVVPGRPGQEVLALLEAGEGVTSRGQMSGGRSVTIIVEQFLGSDTEMERFADRLARRLSILGT